MTYNVGVLFGDDIGPEVVPEAVAVARKALASAGVAALGTNCRLGSLPIARAGPRCLMPQCPRSASSMAGFWARSDTAHIRRATDELSIRIRSFGKSFDMYASYRPAKGYPNVPSLHRNVDLVIVRENTEGFPPDRNMVVGSGEFRPTEDVTISVRVITRRNSERIARAAFELAATRPARHVTAVHKDTVFKLGCGMFAEECRKVASEYPAIAYDEVMVDTFALKLAMQPAAVRRRRHHEHVWGHPGGPRCWPGRRDGNGTRYFGRAPSRNGAGEPRLGARHRGQRDRQPLRRDHVHADDAQSSRPQA